MEVEVVNGEALVERFGGWPSFHDAEIYAVRLDSGQRGDGVVRLQLDVHLPAFADGRIVEHVMVTLEFEEVEAAELEEFGPQNVLFDLILEPVRGPAGRQVQVTLPSSNGLKGSFRCRSVIVLDVVGFEPGEHSVYR
jgi:hypothetical protein